MIIRIEMPFTIRIILADIYNNIIIATNDDDCGEIFGIIINNTTVQDIELDSDN